MQRGIGVYVGWINPDETGWDGWMGWVRRRSVRNAGGGCSGGGVERRLCEWASREGENGPIQKRFVKNANAVPVGSERLG